MDKYDYARSQASNECDSPLPDKFLTSNFWGSVTKIVFCPQALYEHILETLFQYISQKRLSTAKEWLYSHILVGLSKKTWGVA